MCDAVLTAVVAKLISQHHFTVYINVSQVVFTIEYLRVACFIIFTIHIRRQPFSFGRNAICSFFPIVTRELSD